MFNILILSRGKMVTGTAYCLVVCLFLTSASANTADAQTQETTPPAEAAVSKFIDFNRDVLPILESNCMECHGPKEAKEGFRVDEKESLLSYVEPGDLSASSLWNDYLVTADDEMRMPPVSHNKPLTGAQLATIKQWIEEGAEWVAPAVVAAVAPAPAKTQFQRITAFLGLFHPAAVHFPVALLLISAFFLVCSFVYRDAFENAAFHCLWIGAISACASCLLGWFFAESQGYSATPSFDFSKGIERHRWTAITLSALSIAIIPIAVSARRNPNNRKGRIVWLLGASLLALLVSIAGHQGGELVYGEDLYTPAFKAIFQPPTQE
ncbi:MAG: DUF2231 domain-containing protein [Pirellulaceae bacterium]|nr:DUF2231 domain-containing protein [Pirellulaceae bacterium]